jgi:2-succinyl-6-hydroxy-2,4-cyclohexadiene-1-carboxylate synthase
VLHVTVEGSGSAVVLVHGFTQSGRSWGPVGEALANAHTVVRVDAPGHGASASARADLPSGADMMVEAATGAGAGVAAWVGYSMGGRFALHAALRHPAAVRRLVLVSATAGIDDPWEREARRRSDEALASRVGNEGLEPFVRWWLSQPMFASLPPQAAQVESRLDGTAEGLASSLVLAGTGTQEPLWDDLSSLAMPVLALAGDRDAKYAGIAERIADAIGPNATFRLLEGAGHACHLECPATFLQIVDGFLAGG